MTPQTQENRLETAVFDATEAFWEIIVCHYEEVQSGDLDPISAHNLNEVMTTAVKKWLEMNKGE
ncbi:MAG TPA: hypothetical protein HPP97_06950 [Desulfuromonadales bacterium]|nr:hypothetical protein [Desulfuromonadales bacterium]